MTGWVWADRHEQLIMGILSRGGRSDWSDSSSSLRHTTFDGDVCVFVTKCPSHRRRPHRTASWSSVQDRFALPPMHYQSSRYYNYLDFLDAAARL